MQYDNFSTSPLSFYPEAQFTFGPPAACADQWSECAAALSPESTSFASPWSTASSSSPQPYFAVPGSPFYDSPDVLGESSEDLEDSEDDEDSEYTPSDYGSSPILPSLTQRASYKNARISLRPPSSSRPRRASSSKASTVRPRTKSRVHSKVYEVIPDAKLSSGLRSDQVAPGTKYPTLEELSDYVCPVCEHYQVNHRMPDLLRHVDVHWTQERRHWYCCGVPVSEAARFGIKDLSGAEYDEDIKRMMVGGCGTPFARKDAYKRHLGLCTNHCVGDVSAEWVPGNAKRVHS